MAKSSLLWIEREKIDGLLDGMRRPQPAPTPASPVATAAAVEVDPSLDTESPSSAAKDSDPASASSPSVSSPSVVSDPATLPADLAWNEIEPLSRADFDRVGQRLVGRLKDDPQVLEAFVADGDGLFLLGDPPDVTLPVIAAELAGRWHSLRRQLDIGDDPGVVTARIDKRRRLEAVAVETEAEQLRILSWIRSTQE